MQDECVLHRDLVPPPLLPAIMQTTGRILLLLQGLESVEHWVTLKSTVCFLCSIAKYTFGGTLSHLLILSMED